MPFWDNIGYLSPNSDGEVGVGTCTYLGVNSEGEHWVITAEHLLQGGIPEYAVFLGDAYATTGNSHLLGNDIALIEIEDGPELPNCPISPNTSVANDEATFCGSGWYYTGEGTDGSGHYVTYGYGTYPQIRWARMKTSGNWVVNGNDSGVSDGGLASIWDSGGPVFCDRHNGAISGLTSGGGFDTGHVPPRLYDSAAGGLSSDDILPTNKLQIFTAIQLGGSIGDTDGDGDCDASDYVNVVNHLGEGGLGGTAGQEGDTNGDGKCDLDDYVRVVNHLGETGQP